MASALPLSAFKCLTIPRQCRRRIILLTGSPARPHTLATSGIGAAFGAVENLTRHLAMELSPAGVRVACLRTAANPDSPTIQDVTEGIATTMNITQDQAIASLAASTLLQVSPRTTETAAVHSSPPTGRT